MSSTAGEAPRPSGAALAQAPGRAAPVDAGRRARLGEWRDVLIAADPGLNRLLSALQLMASVGVSVGAIYVFMQLTEVLWIKAPSGVDLPPAQLAELAAQHHGITLLAMLLGGLVGMVSSFAVIEPKFREQALTMVLMPVPLLAMMALSIELEPHHAIGIVVLVFVIGFGTYLRKFVPRHGPRIFLYGIMLFVGYLFGFLSQGALTEGQLGWIAVILWLAIAVNLAFKWLVGRPIDRGRLRRTARAFRARCQGVLAAAVAVLDADGPREREKAVRNLHRRQTRLNETALVIDGLIADPDHPSLGGAAFDAHDELFELELLVQNIARTVERLARAELPPVMRGEVRGWLADLRAGRGDSSAAAFLDEQSETASELPQRLDGEVVARVNYLAGAIVDLAVAVDSWPRHLSPTEETEGRFESPVTLILGELPGSSLVSAEAADPGSRRRGVLLSRLGIDPPAQIAIRMMIAIGAAAAIGSIVSERRFYWAVIAVFISFMGANTSGEQVTKAIHRIAGTVLGILLGSLLAHAIGTSTWSLAVIILALGFGVYFMRISYALMVVGITVTVSQLYEQLGEYSNHLLVLRLEETAIGAAVAMAAALLIFPVETRKTATVAARRYLDRLGELLGRAAERVSSRGDGDGARLSSTARGLDDANQQLLAASRPLRHTPFRRDRLEHNHALFSQIAHQARDLVAAVGRGDGLDPDLAASVVVALEREREKVAGIDQTLSGSDGEADCRSEEDLIAPLDESLAAAGAGPHDYERRLVRRIDRLDETVAELDRNLRARA